MQPRPSIYGASPARIFSLCALLGCQWHLPSGQPHLEDSLLFLWNLPFCLLLWRKRKFLVGVIHLQMSWILFVDSHIFLLFSDWSSSSSCPGAGLAAARVCASQKRIYAGRRHFFFQLHRCMRMFEAHRSVCSTVASSPIPAVQLAERALTACNQSQNHPLALSVDVIASASAGAAPHGACAPLGPKVYNEVPERLTRNFLPTLHHSLPVVVDIAHIASLAVLSPHPCRPAAFTATIPSVSAIVWAG